jgi:hypothetical protein
MNASQLLKVAGKVFANRDQEAQSKKLRKKVDLLGAALIR